MQTRIDNLCDKKLEKAEEILKYTEDILDVSIKVDYKEVVRRLDIREEMLKELIKLNKEISEFNDNGIHLLKGRNKKINALANKIILETSQIDNNLRMSIVKELKITESNLNKNGSEINSLDLLV